MSDKKYTATGYGATQQEARSDAQHKINSQISLDNDMDAAFGLTGMAMGVLLGYAILAFALIKSSVFRPLPTMLVSVAVFVIGLVVWNGWVMSLSGGEAFITGFIVIIGGSMASVGVANRLGGILSKIEEVEARAMRSMDRQSRIAATVFILALPVIFYAFWVVGEASSPNKTVFSAIYGSFFGYANLVGWSTLIVTVGSAISREVFHPTASEFNWWGNERPVTASLEETVEKAQQLTVDAEVLDAELVDTKDI
jgi:hypothetical protein